MIYKTKLKNLITAHQSIYAKLLFENINDVQKSHLKKLLGQIQRDIEKLLILKKKNQQSSPGKNVVRKSNNKFLINNKQSSLNTNRVIKSKNKIRYFIRKNHQNNKQNKEKLIELKQITNLAIDNPLLLLLLNEEKLNENDQNNEKEQDSDHSSSIILDEQSNDNNDKKVENNNNDKQQQCNGHGKTIMEKENFLKLLQLVSRNDLEKMVATGKKTTRKRRTTANPQFSHAAIEAKRITKMEIANERRYRRHRRLEQQQQKHDDKQQHQQQQQQQQSLDDYLKLMNVFKATNEMFTGLYCVTINLNNFNNNKEKNLNCKLCQELCQFMDDTIVICKQCLSCYHVICLERQYLIDDGGGHCINCQQSPKQSIDERIYRSENLRLKLIKIQQQILLSTNAINCLKHIFNKKQLQKNQLINDLMELQKTDQCFIDLFDRINNLISNDNTTNENELINDDDDNDDINSIQNDNDDNRCIDNDNGNGNVCVDVLCA